MPYTLTPTSPSRVLPEFSSLRRSAISLCCLAMSSVLLTGCGDNIDKLPPDFPKVTLVGERAGMLVWRAIPDATEYRMDIFDRSGEVRIAHAAPDTVALLPAGFTVASGEQWQVRAYNGRRLLAVSERAPLH